MRRSKVLVTGGAGFLGSHLCEALIEREMQVICVDNLYTGSINNIKHLMSHSNFEFICHDIALPLYIEVDEIYNLACPASPRHYQHDPIQTTKTNVLGALNMLGLAKRHGARIFQASTSEVYGDPKIHPQNEAYWGNVNPIGIRSCYDEGKRCAETLFFDYNRQHNLQIKVARIFNTYGPRMQHNDGRVVSNFIVQALCNKPIAVYGNGLQTRSFCYVDDLINGMIKLMESPTDVTGPINLGNPCELTILELAKKIISYTGSNSSIEFNILPSDDPMQRCPNISLAKNLLHWSPAVELDTGLNRTIEYFKNVYNRELFSEHSKLMSGCSI
jgi:UDP-glucuronate decarboxylase